jgi:hypothetical protein
MKLRRLVLGLAMVNSLWLSAVPIAVAQDSPAKGAQASAATGAPALPHDTHDGLTIQADPYTDRARSKEKFGKADPYAVGILSVEVTLRNESSNLIRVDINTIQLEVRLRSGGRQDLDWLSAEDVAVLIAHPAGASAPSRPRIAGLPIPSGDKKVDKLAEILKPLTLDADTIPPKSAVHGFVYFNVNHEMALSDNAVLYIPDAVLLPGRKALMFFEVPLGSSSQK